MGPATAADPLTANPDVVTVARGQQAMLDVLGNDTSVLSPTLTIASGPVGGGLAEVVDPDGGGPGLPQVRYTAPLAGGSDSFTYQVAQGAEQSSTTVTITLANVGPSAAPDHVEVTSAPGAVVVIQVLANDSDPDGGVLRVTEVTTPSHGAATTDGFAITYDPTDDYVGPDGFSYTITDGQGGSTSAAVTVSVLDATTAMVLADDTLTVVAGGTGQVDVLANDASGGRDPLVVIGASPSAQGGATAVTADARTLTYTPPAGFVGMDYFTYTVADRRGNQASARVTVNVTAPPAVAADIPNDLEFGSDYRVPFTVTGITADGLTAELQRQTGSGWQGVEHVVISGQGGTIGFRADNSLGGLSPGHNSATVHLRVRVQVPNAPALDSTATKANMTAHVRIGVSGPLDRADVRYSYRPGCPVGPASLRRMTINFWDYDGNVDRGSLIVRSDQVSDLSYVFTRAFEAGFQIKKMVPVDAYYDSGKRSPTNSDKASMRAGNTSAFNCRQVVGNPSKRSAHAYGVAIDINTFENPYVVGRGYYPAGAGRYLDRSPCRMGMICRGGTIASAMRKKGWPWGARWGKPDYQHFSSTGG